MTDEELEAAAESWERRWLDDLEPVQFFEGIEEAEARDLDVYEHRPPRQ
jgi:hypothetical protein